MSRFVLHLAALSLAGLALVQRSVAGMQPLHWGLVPKFLLVGALWGCTNPVLKKGTESTAGRAEDEKRKRGGAGTEQPANTWTQYVRGVWATLTNVGFILPFALNQCGSALYVYLLGAADLSMAVPICNSLTFVFTAVTSTALGEKVGRPAHVVAGVVLVLIGVAICIYSKQDLAQW